MNPIIGPLAASVRLLSAVAEELQCRTIYYQTMMLRDIDRRAGQALASISARFGLVQRQLSQVAEYLEAQGAAEELPQALVEPLRALWSRAHQMCAHRGILISLMRGDVPEMMREAVQATLGHIITSKLIVPESPFRPAMSTPTSPTDSLGETSAVLLFLEGVNREGDELKREFLGLIGDYDQYCEARGKAVQELLS
jgi:hypothetical protein